LPNGDKKQEAREALSAVVMLMLSQGGGVGLRLRASF